MLVHTQPSPAGLLIDTANHSGLTGLDFRRHGGSLDTLLAVGSHENGRIPSRFVEDGHYAHKFFIGYARGPLDAEARPKSLRLLREVVV